jgi:hypothetical protein
MDGLSKLFSKRYLLRYAVLFGLWITIQVAASISAHQTLGREQAMLATINPIPPRTIADTPLDLPERPVLRGHRSRGHRTGAHHHGKHVAKPT